MKNSTLNASPKVARPTVVGQRRTEKISEVLAREIVRGVANLAPGTMLPAEAKLIERYQVGRASLREALHLLEIQGLIIIRPGPGGSPMVAQVDCSHFGRIASWPAQAEDLVREHMRDYLQALQARHPAHLEAIDQWL